MTAAGEEETFRFGLGGFELGRVAGGNRAKRAHAAVAVSGARMCGADSVAGGAGFSLERRIHFSFQRRWEGQPPLPAPTVVPRIVPTPLM